MDFGQTVWPDEEEGAIDFCLSSGLRRFYFPPQPGGGFYDWTFLKPTTTLALDQSATFIDCPPDYNGIAGPAVVAASNTITWFPLLTTNEADVRQAYATSPTLTGRPSRIAEVPLRGTTTDQGQRFRLNVFPTPDQAYQIKVTYSILPDALSASAPIPYGGAAHAETILEACLSVAEERLDNNPGVHAASFAARLQASIAQDKRHRPQSLGYNGDRSDDRWDRGPWRTFPPIPINGVIYS